MTQEQKEFTRRVHDDSVAWDHLHHQVPSMLAIILPMAGLVAVGAVLGICMALLIL